MRKVKKWVSCFLVIILSTIIMNALITSGEGIQAAEVDYGVKMCDSILSRYTPATFNSWSYYAALTCEGMWRVYQRTGNTAYYNFVKAWVDRFVGPSGFTGISFNYLDNIMGGILLCHLYETTGNNNYKVGAQQIRNNLNTYPRLTDGSFPHEATSDQTWLDGAFMLTVFLTNYGKTFNDATYANNECSDQLIKYYNHCKLSSGLARHAWDLDGSSSWSDPTTHMSPELWCRSMGWFVAASVEVLDNLPSNHPNRQTVINNLTSILRGLKSIQDPVCGLWYQVPDKRTTPGNWVEESSACLYSYAMAKSIVKGYVTATEFSDSARNAFQGFLSNLKINYSNLLDIYGTCEGTGVGDYNYYKDRRQIMNDLHGAGSFLISYEYQRSMYSGLKQTYQSEDATINMGIVETSNRGFTGASYVNVDNVVGSSIQFTVNVAVAGRKNITIRYASITNRPAKVYVNGSVAISSIPFNATGDWTFWKGQNMNVNLNTGDNTIKLEATTAEGLSNIDCLNLDPDTGVVCFQDADWNGYSSQVLAKGNYTMSQLQLKGIPNDWLSSIRIPPGWTVDLYQNDNFTGTKWTFTADSNYVGSAANDQTSSIIIY